MTDFNSAWFCVGSRESVTVGKELEISSEVKLTTPQPHFNRYCLQDQPMEVDKTPKKKKSSSKSSSKPKSKGTPSKVDNAKFKSAEYIEDDFSSSDSDGDSKPKKSKAKSDSDSDDSDSKKSGKSSSSKQKGESSKKTESEEDEEDDEAEHDSEAEVRRKRIIIFRSSPLCVPKAKYVLVQGRVYTLTLDKKVNN